MTPWNEIVERARALGLKLGVSSAAAAGEGPAFLQWLREGRHGEMAWLAKDPERRLDAARVLPGARSVVSVALSHEPGPIPGLQGPGVARIARYALGDDYHDVLLDKVRTVAGWLGDGDARAYVDTGPVLEKARSARAGLGWTGKHTNLVSRDWGSYVLLGAILTRRDLEPAQAHTDHCGTCRRCLDVCPTGALRPDEPYRLDARRCISYLTIELRGPIPRELRPLIGDWVFGCDLCLEVCPWNRFARPTAELRLRPRPALVSVPLVEMLTWDEATFLLRTRSSPIRRTKRRGLLRNVAVALGNQGDRSAVPALAACLAGEPEPLVRGHAAWALGRLGGAQARAALEAARMDGDPVVRSEVEAALAAGQNSA